MPQCVEAIATIFKAAYSNPDPKENRLPQKRTHKKSKLDAEDNTENENRRRRID